MSDLAARVTALELETIDLHRVLDEKQGECDDLYAEVAALTAKCADYDLLRKAVNDSTNECLPTCSSHGHEEDCPSCDPSRWLKDQQTTIAALTAENERIREAVEGLPRFECTMGGCGDPECCGSYPEMEPDAAGEWVRYADIVAALPSSRETTDGRTDPS